MTDQTQLSSLLKSTKDRENGDLAKDDLYLVMVVEDQTQASVYRAMLEAGVTKAENIKGAVASYQYSGELGTFNYRNSKLKERHNIVEHVLVVSLDEISSSALVRLMLNWDLLDLDVVMVNQFMFTFYR